MSELPSLLATNDRSDEMTADATAAAVASAIYAKVSCMDAQ